MWNSSFIKKSLSNWKGVYIGESLRKQLYSSLDIFLLSLSLPPLPGFSLQDSFEYINQDPNLGKLNTNQNNLGPCRTGSNLGKISPVNGFFFSEYYCCECVFCFIWVYCVVLFFCIILTLCLFSVYMLFALLCVFLSPGLLQACSSKLLLGVAEGGPLRLTRSASFFAGLCGMLSTVWPTRILINPGTVPRKKSYLVPLEIQGALEIFVSNAAKFMVFWKFHQWTSIVNVFVKPQGKLILVWNEPLVFLRGLHFLIFVGLFCCYEPFPFAMASFSHVFTCIRTCTEFLQKSL